MEPLLHYLPGVDCGTAVKKPLTTKDTKEHEEDAGLGYAAEFRIPPFAKNEYSANVPPLGAVVKLASSFRAPDVGSAGSPPAL
jgi:hypothetical protein